MSTRVLIVDDSGVIRRMLSSILSADPEIVVVGTAATSAQALEKIEELNPDVVTLDVEMNGESGLDCLSSIRKIRPRLPVIMFSSLTRRAAETTLNALARGATDYATKPQGMESREAAEEHVRSQLVPKIKVFAPRKANDIPSVRNIRIAAAPFTNPAILPPVNVLAIGSSTGGPNALVELFRDIPADFPVPVVVVQHMPPLFTKLLAERLDRACPLKFAEAVHGAPLLPGQVYIAAGDRHMKVGRAADGSLQIRVDDGPPENSCRPAVDPLFRSVAEIFGSRTLGVILTGMGQDGLIGCRALRDAGGQIVVQDEQSSVVWGMPGFVHKAGLAHRTLPLNQIAGEICRRTLTSAALARASSSKMKVGTNVR